MENEKGIVKLTRKQLYDEIWALSVAGVARKYNLNYGKLIATCKVENISFPSSGYWTKKNMGKDVSNEIVEFSGLEDTEISLITKDAVVKRIRKAKAEVVEKVHTDVTEELDVAVEEDLSQKKMENICLSRFLGYPTGEYLKPESWRCSMIWSATMGLPLSLEGVTNQKAL